jgi:hypothetical protein
MKIFQLIFAINAWHDMALQWGAWEMFNSQTMGLVSVACQ